MSDLKHLIQQANHAKLIAIHDNSHENEVAAIEARDALAEALRDLTGHPAWVIVEALT